MKRFRLYSWGLFFAALTLSVGGWMASANERATGNEKIAPWLAARADGAEELEFLVVLKDQTDLSTADSLLTKQQKGRFVREALWAKAQTTQRSLSEWLTARGIAHRSFYIVNALWVKASVEALNEIAARADVARVEGNPKLTGIQPIGDQSNQNHNSRVLQGPEPGINAIRAHELWAQGFTGQGIVIGGQDTGVEWSHPALRGKYRGSGSPLGIEHNYNWHDGIHSGGGPCGSDAPAPCDDNNHGTHTLGTAVGDDGAGNQIGVAPGAKFIACRNMDRGIGTPATYLECFEFYLAPYPVNGTPAQGDPTKAPDLTTNSWTCPPNEGCSPDTLRAAFEAHRAAGIMPIVSAGNTGPSCSSMINPPSFYDAAYTIGAVDATTGNLAGFSARGPITIDGSNRIKPDITAPGVFVRSAMRGGGYTFLSGTSMATPHVAGAIALLWSARPELRHQIALTEHILNETAVRVDSTDCGSNGSPNHAYGFGRLDIKAAFDYAALSMAAARSTFGAGGGEGSISVTAAPSVNWRAASNDAWLTLTSPTSFTGSATVTFVVAENTSATPRTGSIVIAGRAWTITQLGLSTAYAVAGRIVTSTGEGAGGVTLTFLRVTAGGTELAELGEVETDIDGNWNRRGCEPGVVYRVVPSRGRDSFEPSFRDFNGAAADLNFTVVRRRIILSANAKQ